MIDPDQASPFYLYILSHETFSMWAVSLLLTQARVSFVYIQHFSRHAVHWAHRDIDNLPDRFVSHGTCQKHLRLKYHIFQTSVALLLGIIRMERLLQFRMTLWKPRSGHPKTLVQFTNFIGRRKVLQWLTQRLQVGIGSILSSIIMPSSVQTGRCFEQ